MSFPNPLNWLLRLHPAVDELLAKVPALADRADDLFPRAANGIKRGAEKLAWVREQLQYAYATGSRWAPAFDRIWPIAVAVIERYLAIKRKR